MLRLTVSSKMLLAAAIQYVTDSSNAFLVEQCLTGSINVLQAAAVTYRE
jgi:hypothetical protein